MHVNEQIFIYATVAFNLIRNRILTFGIFVIKELTGKSYYCVSFLFAICYSDRYCMAQCFSLIPLHGLVFLPEIVQCMNIIVGIVCYFVMYNGWDSDSYL